MAPRWLARRVSTAHIRVSRPAGQHWAHDGRVVQISAGGKTTSLGDHDTEEDAARAFDRAAINKQGLAARTNFDVTDYMDEVEDLQSEWALASSWYVWLAWGRCARCPSPARSPLDGAGGGWMRLRAIGRGHQRGWRGAESHRDGGLGLAGSCILAAGPEGCPR